MQSKALTISNYLHTRAWQFHKSTMQYPGNCRHVYHVQKKVMTFMSRMMTYFDMQRCHGTMLLIRDFDPGGFHTDPNFEKHSDPTSEIKPDPTSEKNRIRIRPPRKNRIRIRPPRKNRSRPSKRKRNLDPILEKKNISGCGSYLRFT